MARKERKGKEVSVNTWRVGEVMVWDDLEPVCVSISYHLCFLNSLSSAIRTNGMERNAFAMWYKYSFIWGNRWETRCKRKNTWEHSRSVVPLLLPDFCWKKKEIFSIFPFFLFPLGLQSKFPAILDYAGASGRFEHSKSFQHVLLLSLVSIWFG